MFDGGPSPIGGGVGVGFAAWLRRGRKLTRGKCNKWWKYVPIQCMLVIFSHIIFPFRKVSSAQVFTSPCPCFSAVCSDYRSTKGLVVSTVSAVFASAVCPHSGSFIQKTWTNFSCMTPVCFHSASVTNLLLTFYGRVDRICSSFCLCFSIAEVNILL